MPRWEVWVEWSRPCWEIGSRWERALESCRVSCSKRWRARWVWSWTIHSGNEREWMIWFWNLRECVVWFGNWREWTLDTLNWLFEDR